jgi:hypothetical protein
MRDTFVPHGNILESPYSICHPCLVKRCYIVEFFNRFLCLGYLLINTSLKTVPGLGSLCGGPNYVIWGSCAHPSHRCSGSFPETLTPTFQILCQEQGVMGFWEVRHRGKNCKYVCYRFTHAWMCLHKMGSLYYIFLIFVICLCFVSFKISL